MNRHLNILDYTLSAIVRRLPAHVAAMIIFSAIVFFAASFVLTVQSLIKESRAILSAAPEITVQYLTGGRQVPIPVDVAENIRKIPGVRTSVPRVWGYLYEPYAGANFTLWGVRPDTVGQLENAGIPVTADVFSTRGEHAKVIVGDRVPDVLELNGRKNFTLTNAAGRLQNFEIAGTFNASSSLMTADLILMEEDDLRTFFRMPQDLATDIVVSVANPVEIPMIAMKISKGCPPCRVVSREQVKRTYESIFSYRGGMVMIVWLGCMAAFLILLVNRGSARSSEEHRDLGILKALGWGTADILEMKAFESLFIGICSFVIGFFTAYFHVYELNAALLKPALFGWSVLYPEFVLVPDLSLGPLSLIFILTVVPYFGVSLLPAWKSSSIDAGGVIRGEKQ
jgi:ABC-type lipoprotein release transport system permease subunit